MIYFFPRNGIPSIFSAAERFGTEFREFSVPWNGSERNIESFFSMVQNSEHFLLCGMVRSGIPRIFCSTEQPEQTNCSVYSVFRGIIFLSEIANPSGSGMIYSESGFYIRMRGVPNSDYWRESSKLRIVCIFDYHRHSYAQKYY